MRDDAPSETAVRIAINMAATAGDRELRRTLAAPEERFSEAFVAEHSLKARQQLALWRSDKGRPILQSLADGMEPGGPLFIVLRKRWIEDRVREGLAGARQCVILGAGYDTLALRLHDEFKEATFLELDHPATQAVKRRALERLGGVPPRLTLVPLDLGRSSLRESLAAQAALDPKAPSIFVAEGLLMYFREAEVDTVVASVARRKDTLFVFSFVDRRELLRKGSPAYKAAVMLKLSGEPILSSLDPESLEGYLSERGLTLVGLADHEALRKTYLEPLGIDRAVGTGEWLAVARSA